MTQRLIPVVISILFFIYNYQYIKIYLTAIECFFPVLHCGVSSKSLTSCQNKHSLSRSHVSRGRFQGKVVLVYAAVLS